MNLLSAIAQPRMNLRKKIPPCKGKAPDEKLAAILMRAFSKQYRLENREASGLRRLQRRFRADEGDEKTDDFRACQKRF